MKGNEDVKKGRSKETTRIRLSLNLQNGTERENHCFGINSLLLLNRGVESTLFSAGRDASIRSWSVHNEPISHEKAYEGHSDWVNDILLINNGDSLLSCSSDNTVKLWSTNQGLELQTYSWHKDYVKALACPTSMTKPFVVASAGLDGNVFLWDLEQEGSRRLQCGDPPESIYSAAMSGDGNIVFAGCSSNFVRVFDVRSEKKIVKLKGHSDNVKALITNNNGNFLISGSSDSTIKEWDLRMPPQCIHTLRNIHKDAVWSLCWEIGNTNVGSGLDVYYSGGRDGTVWRTNSQTRQSTLVCQEPAPILKIIPDHLNNSVWVSTALATINNWKIDTRDIRPVEDNIYVRAEKPHRTIPGRAGIIKHHNILNRRQVLTAASDGRVVLWDVCNARCDHDYGIVTDSHSFERIAASLQKMQSIPSWFTTDVKTGSLVVHLDFPDCFNARLYVMEAGFPPSNITCERKDSTESEKDNGTARSGETTNIEEVEVNLAERLLVSLFQNWLKGLVSVKVVEQAEPVEITTPGVGENAAEEGSQDKISGEVLSQEQGECGRRPDETGQTDSVPPETLQPEMTERETAAVQNQTTSAVGKEVQNNLDNSLSSLLNTTNSGVKPPGQLRSFRLSASGISSPTVFNPNKINRSFTSTENAEAKSNIKSKSSTDLYSDTNNHNSSKNNNHNSNNNINSNNNNNNNSSKNNNHNINNNKNNNNNNNNHNHNHNNNNNDNTTKTAPGVTVKTNPSSKLPLYDIPANTFVVLGETDIQSGASRVLFRKTVGEFTGEETLPPIIQKCLLEGEYPCHTEQKLSFFLSQCQTNKYLPYEKKKRYQASRLLRVSRISLHIVETALGLVLPTRKTQDPKMKVDESTNSSRNGSKVEEGSIRGEPNSEQKVEELVPASEFIQILCNDHVLPSPISLATVQQFYWKVKEDLCLTYRINPLYDGPVKIAKKEKDKS